MNRRWIACDLSENYCNITLRRLKKPISDREFQETWKEKKKKKRKKYIDNTE